MNGNGALPWPEITVGPQGGVKIWVRSYNESEKTAFEWALEADQLLAKQIARDARKAGIGENREHRQERFPDQSPHGTGDALEARDRLAAVLTDLAYRPECKQELARLKAYKDTLTDPEFVWRSLVESLSGWGSSAGYERLVRNQENYDRLKFACLARLSPADRFAEIDTIFRAARVRYRRASGFLLDNFSKIEEMGGPEKAKADLLNEPGRDDKIRVLKQFKGIKNKFARNIFMNVYHEDFRQSIALDSRISSISETLGLSFRNYDDEEQFYLDVAQKAGLDGWDVDRLIYNFRDYVLAGLREQQPKSLRYA